MDIFSTILWPLKWIIELVLYIYYHLFSSINNSVAWSLSIIFLVITVRACLIPLFVKQIKSQRKTMELAPKIRAIQQKYKGRKDQFSRQQMAQEQMALYKEAKANPLSGCLPILVQLPVFFGLYSVLRAAADGNTGVGFLDQTLSDSFALAKFFGASLSTTLINAVNESPVQWSVVIVAVILVICMISSQLYTSMQIMNKNTSEETKSSPMFRQQKILMYAIPFVMIISGVAFPIGLVLYWFVSNIWTMCQQSIIINRNPNPGSVAYLKRQKKLGQKGKLTETEQKKLDKIEGKKLGQRQQPVNNKKRKKKNGK